MSRLAWSPEGTRIAYADGGSVRVIEVDVGERSRLADSFDDIVDRNGCADAMGYVGDGPVWSPSGQIAYSDCGTWVVASADGTGRAQPLGSPSGTSR